MDYKKVIDKCKACLTRKNKKFKLNEIYDKDYDNHVDPHDELCSDVVKKNTVYKRTRMSNFGLKLSNFYKAMPMWKILLITIVTAIFFGIISVFFVKNVGIYNFGFAAFGQAAARLITSSMPESIAPTVRNLIDQAIFWIAYIILSIPIFIFGYKKIGRVFTNLTVIFLVVSSMVSFLIGMIPGANQAYIIGNFDNEIIKKALPKYQVQLSSIIPLLWSDAGNVIALMIYSICYGYMLAWVFAIIAVIGGTAGVTGVIGEWYANTKQKSFGSISGNMNIIIIFITVALGSYLPGSLLLENAERNFDQIANSNLSQIQIEAIKDVISKKWSAELYFSPNFVATILTNIVYILVLNKLFPKFKLVRVEIFSTHYELVQTKLANDKRIVTGLTMFKAKGGFKGEHIDVITSITLFRQVPRLIKRVRAVDPDAFIAVSDVTSIDGYVYLPTEKF
ncbi:YitT family protein [Mycoplasmopsis pullorum]|uniref:DUF2179 domain-containing protein n=1 Tax=Mycoplasmopsis pullorum TaxID=48003 RepID=UPI0011186BB9|nr:DUF2179 domain-containing protein [Mycoplasmopsis pullorum]TNK82207.1 YitT family protein [Mycoplasmopsis pullorum]TNK82528.1 YitT family protein [Mycoplasmopsis pullorum]TNK84629.1 YitT family protein [Mycoplasmopsis pullorum]TNK85339.1 YitT family protein [Mycoplasmopsis pullorum]TNK86310.1 YitT family protein [Mycoplasmopsis pullorum]